ncbi:MAG: UDP-3-O-(3-hydroxymyristoyl)glucosamine N-acyltransferase [Trueperaceae bacterium]|nr:UDP-3-O-(3-hydroxymyristoyl)glucosamine N-acyltransferase [Trueperaceae bacterium]
MPSDDASLRETLNASGADRLAAIVVASDAHVATPHPPLLRHPDPRLALARISRELDPEPAPPAGVASSATVADDATLGADVSVGPGAVVESGAELADGCVIGAGAVVGRNCRLGPGTRLFARVVLYPGVRIGARVRIHAGAVVGADGFGYAPGPHGAEKVHHLGGVTIGDDVEIGANACIDRGTLGDTAIGNGTKLDNLCQVGHNVTIGRHCLIAGQTAIGGSTVIEDGVLIGGSAALSDHVRVGAGARIAGRAGVSKNVPAGQAWGGAPAAPMRDWARERYLVGRLERIWTFVRGAQRAEAQTAQEASETPVEGRGG